VSEFQYGDEVFVPPKADDPLIKSILLPRGVEPHATPYAMVRSIGGMLNEVVPLHPQEQLILGTFPVLAAVCDGLLFAPTVCLCGPRDITIPLLKNLNLICQYSLVVGDMTPSGLFHASSRIKPTLLIADYELPPRILRLLEMGSRPGIFSLQKGAAYSSCCPRVIACSDASVGRDLLSGGVMISLTPLGWPNLGLLSDPGFLGRAACLQRQLLRYDLEWNGTIHPLKCECPRRARPREWDAFRCWGAPFEGEEPFLRELREAIRCAAEASPDGLPVDQVATICALHFLVHKRQDHTSVGEIATHANRVLGQMGEDIRLKERKVGAILTKLGFPRRQRGGDDGPYQLQFDVSVKEMIDRLVKFYGAWEVELYDNGDPRVMCPLCRECNLVSEGELRWYEQKLKPAEERRKREEQAERERRMERLRENPPRLIINESGHAGGAASYQQDLSARPEP
jgi:hypothetical protein